MMTEPRWLTAPDALDLLDHLYPVRGQDSAEAQTRASRLYLLACARRAWDRLPWVARALVEIAEALADGEITDRGVRVAARAAAEELTHCRGEPEALAEVERKVEALGLVRPAGTPPGDPTADPDTWTARAYLVYYPFAGQTPHYRRAAGLHSADLVREVFSNPFRPPGLDRAWVTPTVEALARGVYATRDFFPMPVLADALQDAGCDDSAVLAHCRDPHGAHVRGCWVLEAILRPFDPHGRPVLAGR